ncbi:MAG: hopanoid-associated sugar epimerase [Pseudomonadota bacterium]
MTVLVTGATGFIGTAVARCLLQRGDKVRVLLRESSQTTNLDDLQVERIVGDLGDSQSLNRAVDGCEGVFHVAADYRLWVPKPKEIYRINVDGTRDLLTAAHNAGVKRIVYTSSVATLGLNADGSPSNEHTPVSVDQMIGHYKRSKYLAEELVKEMVNEQGLPAVIVNPSAPVGPRDIKPTPTGRTILDAARGAMPAYVDTGLNIVHVEDVAKGHLLAYDKGQVGQRYILGCENLSLREIFEIVCGLTEAKPPRVKLPVPLLMPVAWVAEAWAMVSGREPMVTRDGLKLAKKKMFFSSERAKAELGYDPRPAKIALADAVTWFKTNGYF